MSEFRYVAYAQEVVFGPGSLKRLGEAIERNGWRRLMLCSSRSLRLLGIQDALIANLDRRPVVTFDQVQPHVQDFQVAEALSLVEESEIDAIIGLGGGSPIGMAKAIASKLNGKVPDRHGQVALPSYQPTIPVIAIPTTYAGSEMTAIYGITETQDKPARKVTVRDPTIIPKLVIYDPTLTLALSPEMTASTGINALAHCIEALYSIRRHPLSTAAATAGIRHIDNSLLQCFIHGDDLESRAELMLGAHLAGFSLASAAMGLHHGLCHVLGGTFNVPHGIANGIILPHAIRFNAEATSANLLFAAVAMDLDISGRDAGSIVEAVSGRIFQLIGQLKLPQRLREVGVGEEDLPAIAQLAFENHTVRQNPMPVKNPYQLEVLLREAW